MIINVELGLNCTPLDYTGLIEYAAINGIVIDTVDDDVLVSLAEEAINSGYTDNSAIIDVTVEKFIGVSDYLGTVKSLPENYTKDVIINYLKNNPTIENVIVARILTQVIENVEKDDHTELVDALNEAIADKLANLAILPIGQFFEETLILDTLHYGAT
jgi:hypothetical protein